MDFALIRLLAVVCGALAVAGCGRGESVHDGTFAEHGGYAIVDISGFYEFSETNRQRVVVRVENLLDEQYATTVRTTQSDLSETYLYDNLGVPRTLHLSYRFSF